MAMMSPLQRRRFEEIIRQNPGALSGLVGARGMDLGSLVGAGDGNLAALAGMQPPPVQVTAAQPAPQQPGREIQAPQESPLPPASPMGPGYRRDGAVQNAVSTADAIIGDAAYRAAQMSDEAARAAVVPAEVEAILGKREKRYAEQLAEVEEDKKKAGWEALAMAGFRMAQSQSPYFMSALATGMEAGLNGFNAGKAARAEKKARLQTSEEDVVLAREAAKQKARADAEARQARELEIARTLIGQGEAADKLAEFRNLAPYRARTAAAQATEAEVMPELRRAQTKSTLSEASYRDRSPGAGMGGGQPATPRPLTESQKLTNARILQGRIADNRIRLQDPAVLGSPKIVRELQVAIANDEDLLRQIMGGARPMAPAAPPPAARPAAAPRPGAIVDGYRFKGGNPADRKNWEKVR